LRASMLPVCIAATAARASGAFLRVASGHLRRPHLGSTAH
jgi:hypothetical protein